MGPKDVNQRDLNLSNFCLGKPHHEEMSAVD